jgi:hypothetical protein
MMSISILNEEYVVLSLWHYSIMAAMAAMDMLNGDLNVAGTFKQ